MNPTPGSYAGAATRVVPLDASIDLRSVLGALVRGAGDPTLRVDAGAAIRASMTPDGPGALELRVATAAGEAPEVRAWAWGPGAERLLDGVPALLGLDDDDAGFEPGHHPRIAELARRRGRIRLGRTGAVWEALLPAILEQKITGTEAWRNYRRLVRAHGQPGPGPLALCCPPTAAQVAGLPQYALIALGIEPRRATLLRRIAAEARRFEAFGEAVRGPGQGGQGASNLAAALQAHSGIGPWTAAEVTLRALGDPDAVSVGDFHLSHVVGFALAGEPRATDERMLQLLAPWGGHRARVVKLLEGAGIGPPRYGPRVAPRDLARDLTPREPRRGEPWHRGSVRR
ncbi:MAG TPA: DNA-3-methyladenine glycosylase 2 family protein [Candidatus Limnocylindria bacterium]|nr:DNA-3-methyladenine glycosylase 2 family protein [Candidatus Limnocylindria bacterium]